MSYELPETATTVSQTRLLAEMRRAADAGDVAARSAVVAYDIRQRDRRNATRAEKREEQAANQRYVSDAITQHRARKADVLTADSVAGVIARRRATRGDM